MAYRSFIEVVGANGVRGVTHIVDGVADLPAIATQTPGNRAYGILGAGDGRKWEAQKMAAGMTWVEQLTGSAASLPFAGDIEMSNATPSITATATNASLTLAGNGTGKVVSASDLDLSGATPIIAASTTNASLTLAGNGTGSVKLASDVILSGATPSITASGVNEGIELESNGNGAIVLDAGTGTGGVVVGAAGGRIGFHGTAPAAQPAAVADCVPAADGTSAGTQLNVLLARLRANGFIAT